MPGGPEYSKPIQEWRALPNPQTDSDANPLASLLGEQRGGGERSHEELVAIIRKDMAAYIARKDPYQFDPVSWMREELAVAIVNLSMVENPPKNPQDSTFTRESAPHAQLMMAWDLISQPHYKSGYHRSLAASGVKDDARHLGHTITLDPQESMLLDAMAEAVGIPNPLGPMTPEKQTPK